jgi:Cysteine-rich secretory protein family
MGKRFWICLIASALSLLGSVRSRAQQPDEQALLEATNRDRAAQGLGPLQWDPALAQAAAAHAQLMAQQQQLSHQYPGEPDLVTRAGQNAAHFRSIAENVALGPTPEAIERQWMNSAPHRANILDPRMNAIGVALINRKGNYYAVEDFSDRIPGMGSEEIERKVGALLKERGIDPTGPVQDARQTCEMPHGSAGGSSPKFVMRWEGSDLSHLPPQLEQQIQGGQYHKAAVGACDSAHPQQGFTTYRVAVMLY